MALKYSKYNKMILRYFTRLPFHGLYILLLLCTSLVVSMSAANYSFSKQAFSIPLSGNMNDVGRFLFDVHQATYQQDGRILARFIHILDESKIDRLFFIDLNKQQLLWEPTLPDGYKFGELIAWQGDYVYLLMNEKETRTHLFKWDLSKKKVQWQMRVGKTEPNICYRAIKIDSKIFILLDNEIACAAADDGKRLWSYNLNGEVGNVLVSGDKNTFFVLTTKRLFAFDADRKEIINTFSLPPRLPDNLILTQSRLIYFPGKDRLVIALQAKHNDSVLSFCLGFDSRRLTPVWEYGEKLTWIMPSFLTISEDMIYVPYISKGLPVSMKIVALSADTGHQIWSRILFSGVKVKNVSNKSIFAPDVGHLAGSSVDEFPLLDPQNGKVVSTFNFKDYKKSKWWPYVVNDGIVLFQIGQKQSRIYIHYFKI